MRIKIIPDEPGEYETSDVMARARIAINDAFPEYEDVGSGAYVSTDQVGTIDIHYKKR